jgi:hypothetical protein
MSKLVLAFALAVPLLSVPASAQEPCPKGTVDDPSKYVEAVVNRRAKEAQEEARKGIRKTTPTGAQTGASAASSEGTSVVDGASFPTLLGAAFENGLLERENGAFSVDLNLFAFKALRNRELLSDAFQYSARANQRLRRLGGTLSLGGTGEKFDRDGDGTDDDPLTAKQLDDIINYELRWRFYGTRDRQDDVNYARYFGSNAVKTASDLYRNALTKLNVQVILALKGSGTCVPTRVVDAAIESTGLLDASTATMVEFLAADQDVLSLLGEIDNSLVLTFVAGGVERKDDFGPDRQYAGLRVAWNRLEANADYTEVDQLSTGEEPSCFKLGVKTSGFLWADVPAFAAGDPEEPGVKWSLEGSWETFDDVPDAKHDTNLKLAVRLDFPLAKGVSLPASIQWANHEDLLTEADGIRGHFGVALKLGELLNTTKKK